jgi:Ca-activated chloride channel family protein
LDAREHAYMIRAFAVASLLAAWQFASGVNLVEVYATVTTAEGELVKGLSQDDFEVLEDGVPQRISAFTAGDFPMSVALALDRSWSMAGEPLALARSASHTFLGQLRQGDRAMLLGIGSGVETLTPLTGDVPALHRALEGMQPWGTTSLHDAILAAMDEIEPAGGRRALLLLSDGVDRYSTATSDDAVQRARGADVLVYPIALGRSRPSLFVELAVISGGRSFHLRAPKELSATFATIAEELRNQYLLGYSPARPLSEGRGEWRGIEVKVRPPNLRVRARDGYVAR